jgi:hypothetical protein
VLMRIYPMNPIVSEFESDSPLGVPEFNLELKLTKVWILLRLPIVFRVKEVKRPAEESFGSPWNTLARLVSYVRDSDFGLSAS